MTTVRTAASAPPPTESESIMRTPSDQDAANARGILEAIADCRSDGDYERAETMIRQVAGLPAESLHILIDVAAALAVTVRDWREEGQ